MRFFNCGLVVLISVVSSMAQSATNRVIRRDRAESFVIPGHYIVEFSEAALAKRASPTDTDITVFYKSLNEKGIKATPKLNITSTVFLGTSFAVTDKTRLEEIEELDVVKNVWPVKKIPKPGVRVDQIGGDAMWTSHSQTGVLDLHAQGIQGEGATVAIVDTGIDYTHPSLGGCFGSGCKVDGGTDIVGDNYTGGAFFPDPDPMDQMGHGTHVAGIIAASNDPNFVSVAPMANLRIYKVFGEVDTTSTDALVLAFVTAFNDGADVISSSIGGPGGFPEDPWAVVASRIVDEGVFVSISAGNDGAEGLFYGSSGSTGVNVTAVASIDTENFFAFPANITFPNGTVSDIPYLAPLLEPFAFNSTVPIFIASTNTTIVDDACDPLPDSTPDLSNMLVLIRRGTCTFQQKQDNVVAKGAKFLWFYNLDNQPITYPSITNQTSQGYAMISASDGEGIVKAIASGANVTAFFPQTGAVSSPNTATGGKMSTFTTWGPSNEAQIKSEIAAPGGFIYSTYPVSLGSHAILSGTSMACPYIAGIAALYIGKAGGKANLGVEGVKELRSRILTSGNFVNFNNGTATDVDHIAPVPQQGSGYVNAVKVVNYATSLSPAKLELNDTAHFTSSQIITVSNSGNTSLTYTVSHETASTVNTFSANDASDIPTLFPPTLIDDTASVTFSTSELTVEAGSTGTVSVTFTPPDLSPDLLPVFSGKIVFTASNGEVVGAAYQGIAGNLIDVPIWDAEAQSTPLIVNDATFEIVEGPQTWLMNNVSRPAAAFFNTFATQQLRWDIVTVDWSEDDWVYPPAEGENEFVGSIVGASDEAAFPQLYLPRVVAGDFYYENWVGELTNGSVIASGTYRFLFRVLKLFGDPTENTDWQTVLSDPQTIQFSNTTSGSLARRDRRLH